MKKKLLYLLPTTIPGHVTLLKKNLQRSGIINKFKIFINGKELLDFLFDAEQSSGNGAYLLLLDIRMPKIDGIQVLEKIKQNKKWKKMPVIMLTTNDAPDDINKCYEIGCSNYIVKPVEYNSFIKSLGNLGLFLTVVEVPEIN